MAAAVPELYQGLHQRAEPANEQHTETVLEDVDLRDDAAYDSPGLPMSGADVGADAGVGVGSAQYARRAAAAQAERYKATRRERIERYWSRFSVFLLHVCERLPFVPRSWLVVVAEDGTSAPEIVRRVRAYYRNYCTAGLGAVCIVLSLLWLLQFLLGAPSAVLHDGTHLHNVYSPSSPSHMNLASEGFVAWLGQHRPNITEFNDITIKKRFFSAPVYAAGESRNMTLDWLRESLSYVCQDHACDCMPAVELGIMASAVIVQGDVWLNPYITDTSTERIDVEDVSDGTRMYAPVVVIVRYMCMAGNYHKKTLDRGAAFCMARAQALMTGKAV